MKKFNVYGSIPVHITFRIEAESEEDAIDKAYENFPGLTNYLGNGGVDQILGVNDSDISLDGGCQEPEFTTAEEDTEAVDE
jgi:hypothetical protein